MTCQCRWLAAAFCLLICAGCASMTQKDYVTMELQARTMDREITKTAHLQYYLYLPEGYGQGKRDWPLMLFMHGAGERGDDLAKVKVHGPVKMIEEGKEFPFVIVAPQCPEDAWWPMMTDELSALLDEIEENYRIDENRIYVTGLSMGGYGAWSLAIAEPERFAAIAPVCGGGDRHQAAKIKNVPAWVFHGGKDPVVSIDESKAMVEALEASGGTVKFTIYPDAEHDSWTETYNSPELYDWFLSHSR